MKSIFLSLLFFPLLLHGLQISPAQAQDIGLRIWKNECNQTKEGLLSWNIGEEFASLGIGHFIWYPEGKRGPFNETFPSLLQFFERKREPLPSWLHSTASCPWKNKQEFETAKVHDEKWKQLQNLLLGTLSLQALFMAERLEKTLPQLKPQGQLDRLLAAPNGLYALLDYLNFKGDGLNPQEQYAGHGWGLKQVLENMPGNSEDPVREFVLAAKKLLKERVEHAPQERNEGRWLKGWFSRLDTY